MRQLEYLQFSENLQVRRAATEGISNLVPNDAAVAMIAKDRLKLWLLLAEAHEESFDVARAALSGLAMAFGCDDAAESAVTGGAVKVGAGMC